MSEKVLVIVESPTKARTIKRFLPKGFEVEASVGHIRDLPQSAAEIPKDVKDKEWARIGIDVDNNFAPLYVTPKGKSKVVSQLKKLCKDADFIYLATDEDREGESISWHLVEVLKPNMQKVKRMVFHEITESAIKEAIQNTRSIDLNLVHAQEARRILDRLYGYTLSPLLWKKISFGLSAGRVQSPGLRLIVQREFERIAFKKSTYHDLLANLAASSPQVFEARLSAYKGQKIATGKDFDSTTGELKSSKGISLLSQADAESLRSQLEKAKWKVTDLSEKEVISRPSIPFVTSTLQQEANRKLGLSSRETMRIAQKLYEEGLITYMRTDSPNLSKEAIAGARSSVETLYGKEYLSPVPRQFNAKSKGAQEAHEAIRPSGYNFLHPDKSGLFGKEKALYEMIWKRTLACQMADAKKMSMTVQVEALETQFTAHGSRILFPGFLRVYVEGSDDPEQALDDKEVILPPLTVGQELELKKLTSQSHETKPPARYTEASLIERLEKEGIGRPSTYASIIDVLFERTYIRKEANALIPTFTGICVTQFLERNFSELVNFSFTSQMESTLDDIAAGSADKLDYLKSFYLGDQGLKYRVESRDKNIKTEESRTLELPQLDKKIELKIGRFGPYVVVGGGKEGEEVHASIPETIAPGDLLYQDVMDLIEVQKNGPAPIGVDPETKKPVYCLTGRYGPYVQLGEVTEAEPKPKRATLPKGLDPKNLDIAKAMLLLALPRTLGAHPQTKLDIVANNGRFGPYVVHDGEFRSLKKTDDVYTITLERALELLAEEKKAKASLVKDFGPIAEGDFKGQSASIQDGRYGLYLKVGATNIKLPDNIKSAEGAQNASIADIMPLLAGVTPKKEKASAKAKTTVKKAVKEKPAKTTKSPKPAKAKSTKKAVEPEPEAVVEEPKKPKVTLIKARKAPR